MELRISSNLVQDPHGHTGGDYRGSGTSVARKHRVLACDKPRDRFSLLVLHLIHFDGVWLLYSCKVCSAA